MSRTRFWVWTLNNWTRDEEEAICTFAQDARCTYLVYGRELAPTTGTPHLQGYTIFESDVRLSRAKSLLGTNRLSLRRANGTPQQASDYCKKDGDYVEFGSLPESSQGKRTDWERFRTYVESANTSELTDRLLFERFPGLYARYRDHIHEFIRLIRPEPILVADGDAPRPGWQRDLYDTITTTNADSRTVNVVISYEGNKGKSWFCQYMESHHSDVVQTFCVGKRDDIAHALDYRKKIFLFDVPRDCLEHFQWPLVEMLKNRLIWSPKYGSKMKKLEHMPHVVVFTNEDPPQEKLSADRWNIIDAD